MARRLCCWCLSSRIVGTRLEESQTKLADLTRMKKALSYLIHECEHTGREQSCAIIATLMGDVR